MGIFSGNSQPYQNRKSNGKFWFFIFIVVLALFLHYREEKHPLVKLKQDVATLLGITSDQASEKKNTQTDNAEDNVAFDDQTKQNAEESSGKDAKPKNEEPSEESTDSESTNVNDLVQFLPASKPDDEIVRHSAYILNYQEDYEQAAWVVHRIPPNARSGKAKRAREFKPDPLVSTGSAVPQDYVRSGYDRGHLAPAGDFKYDQMLTYETFYMSNMSPQKPELNQGIWNDMEIKIRDWAADRGGLIAVTGPVLKPGLESIGRANKVAVPAQYFKIVYDDKKQEAIAFLMSNEGHYELLSSFVVSIDEIEKLTGYDFFAKLPDALEKRIESQRNVDDWF